MKYRAFLTAAIFAIGLVIISANAALAKSMTQAEFDAEMLEVVMDQLAYPDTYGQEAEGEDWTEEK
ncbi:MAG: hypothetical protein DSY80_07130 [Desulfocapsa sp.]|nr:MAG: hypothetical protein DSY80_07130 [Desulfocapsa sp.]